MALPIKVLLIMDMAKFVVVPKILIAFALAVEAPKHVELPLITSETPDTEVADCGTYRNPATLFVDVPCNVTDVEVSDPPDSKLRYALSEQDTKLSTVLLADPMVIVSPALAIIVVEVLMKFS